MLGVVVNNKAKKLNFRAHKAVILATGGSAGNVTSAMPGKAVIPDLPYEQPDGSPIRIDNDYSGKSRSQLSPTRGPFEQPGMGPQEINVW